MSEASSCPTSQETPAPGCRLGALYWACVRNDPVQLQATLDGGVSPEEAIQVDGNGRVSYPRCFPGHLEQCCVPAAGHSSNAWILGRKGGVRVGVNRGWDISGIDVGFRGHRGCKEILEKSAGAELSLPQTGLMVACYRGFESVVALLSRCPFLDVNQQDKEGDTALMLAAQAGERLLTLPSTSFPHFRRVNPILFV